VTPGQHCSSKDRRFKAVTRVLRGGAHLERIFQCRGLRRDRKRKVPRGATTLIGASAHSNANIPKV
jgi:hypothetical protein